MGLLLSYLKLKFGFFGVFCAGGLGDLAVSVIKYVNIFYHLLFCKPSDPCRLRRISFLNIY